MEVQSFVLHSPSTDWTRPTHMMEGNLLYSVSSSNVRVIWKHTHRHTRSNNVWPNIWAPVYCQAVHKTNHRHTLSSQVHTIAQEKGVSVQVSSLQQQGMLTPYVLSSWTPHLADSAGGGQPCRSGREPRSRTSAELLRQQFHTPILADLPRSWHRPVWWTCVIVAHVYCTGHQVTVHRIIIPTKAWTSGTV